jgi:hypothetical protein
MVYALNMQLKKTRLKSVFLVKCRAFHPINDCLSNHVCEPFRGYVSLYSIQWALTNDDVIVIRVTSSSPYMYSGFVFDDKI